MIRKNSSFWKHCLALTLSMLVFNIAYCQVKNTSYITEAKEKVLRLEADLPVGIHTAWALFTTDEGLKKWIAPQAHIDLKTGGYIITNYDKGKPLTDPSSIKLPIISYLQSEMLTLKVNLNSQFKPKVRSEDKNLQEIIQFVEVGPGVTRIVSSMIGWGKGKEWDKTYDFFAKGNEWTYQELLKNYK